MTDEPLMPPQRDVARAMLDMLGRMIGTDRIVRYVAHYLVTCRCGALLVTTEESTLKMFREAHPPGHVKANYIEDVY